MTPPPTCFAPPLPTKEVPVLEEDLMRHISKRVSYVLRVKTDERTAAVLMGYMDTVEEKYESACSRKVKHVPAEDGLDRICEITFTRHEEASEKAKLAALELARVVTDHPRMRLVA